MRRLALPIAVLLSVSLVAPAAAATTGQISETFTVARELALYVSRTTVNYGVIAPDQLSPAVQFEIIVEFGGESGWDLEVSGTDFVTPNNSAAIPASARRLSIAGGTGGVQVLSGELAVTASPVVIAHMDANSGTDLTVLQTEQWIDLLGQFPPSGDYSGTTTYSLSGL